MSKHTRLPALALFDDTLTERLEGRWVMRPWHRGENRPARGPPWRFATRKDAEQFARTRYPGLSMRKAAELPDVDVDGLHSLWL